MNNYIYWAAAIALDQVIEANNASNVGLKKRDVQLARQEDIMDGRVQQLGFILCKRASL